MSIKEVWRRLRAKPMGYAIKRKHRFVVMDTNTFKEKFSFELSGLNVFVAVGVTVIVLILLTTVLIAFTPLREYIPGYTNTEVIEQTYANARRVDSLEVALGNQEWYVATLRAILRGEELGEEVGAMMQDSTVTLASVAAVYRRSREDSLLRYEVEQADGRYEVKVSPTVQATADRQPAVPHLFFAPLKGTILRPYNSFERHYGVDIAAVADKPVMAAYGGTVVFAGFAAEDGYVVVIQHTGNILTIYRNVGVLLKHQGDAVRAGEPVAYVGSAGHRSPEPYLHLELWVGGNAVNPEEYISF
ncbi:MAG: M23 family metallopeptidase [Bacteroidales bacterium]|nr:M23 family metallopeptidase [Bacteroidales bacterium]